MVRKLGIAILIILVIGGGAWYYLNKTSHTKIDTILKNPGSYEGKEITIQGEVTDRTAFFNTIKFFRLRDQSGEIIVVSQNVLPETRSSVVAKGRVDQAFQVGQQKFTVFMAGSIEQAANKK